ncbi:MAG: hypothetical protein U0Y68_15200 [Blastocatellia bacterium]
MSSSLVTITTFFPTLGAIVIMLYSIIQLRRGKSREEIRPHYRWIAFIVSMITFVLSLGFLLGFDGAKSGPQLVTKVSWIQELGVHYYIGVDGISLWLVLLTTFLVPGAVMASWTFTKRVHELMIFILILETGMIGVFVSLDLFLFYLF